MTQSHYLENGVLQKNGAHTHRHSAQTHKLTPEARAIMVMMRKAQMNNSRGKRTDLQQTQRRITHPIPFSRKNKQPTQTKPIINSKVNASNLPPTCRYAFWNESTARMQYSPPNAQRKGNMHIITHPTDTKQPHSMKLPTISSEGSPVPLLIWHQAS